MPTPIHTTNTEQIPTRDQIIVQIIGQPGAGKTTLVAALVSHFTRDGLAVGTLKHSSHAYELDKPGKDSHVHRNAGAVPAAMVNSKMAALYLPASENTRPGNLIRTYYRHADIVLIEGWISGPYPKIEIWRQSIEKSPLYTNIKGVCALVCDTPPENTKEPLPGLLALDNIASIAGFIRHHCKF